MSPALMDLSKYRSSYRSEKSGVVRALWFFVGLPLLRCQLLPSSSIRARLLRLFGAEIGTGVVIKPGVRVKYPWLLSVGDHTWIGEDCWIDNLGPVQFGNNVCDSCRQSGLVCEFAKTQRDQGRRGNGRRTMRTRTRASFRRG